LILTLPKLLGLGGAAGGLVLFGNELGVLAAAVLVVVGIVAPVEYVVAVGQVALVVVAPERAGVLLLGVEAGLGLFVAGAMWKRLTDPTAGLVFLFGYAVLGSAVWTVVTRGAAVWHAAVGLWFLALTAGYLLHRHHQIERGLTTEELG
jgi:hypothetical protein